MTAQPGSQILLKVGDNASPENFFTVGGLNLTSFIQRNPAMDATNVGSGPYRELLEGGGVRSVSISGSGRFEDSVAETMIRSYALSSCIRNYQITFGNGDMLSGKFLITSYQRGGVNAGVEAYTLALASSGPIAYTAA